MICITLLSVFIIHSISDYLLKERIKLIDIITFKSISSSHNDHDHPNTRGITNYLFRGNIPLTYEDGSLCNNDQKFEVKLFKYLSELIKKHNFNLYTNYELETPNLSYDFIDISLVNIKTKCPDKHDLTREIDFINEFKTLNFEHMPATVKLYNWVLLGDQQNPRIYNDDLEKKQKLIDTVDIWQLDLLHDRVAMLNQLLKVDSKQTKNRVIYIHCEQGQDRTGQIIGAYALFNQYTMYSHILNANLKTTNVNMLSKHRNALDWYCEYLRSKYKKVDCSESLNSKTTTFPGDWNGKMLESFASHTCTIILLHDVSESSDLLYKFADINNKRSQLGNCKFIIPDAKTMDLSTINSKPISSWHMFFSYDSIDREISGIGTSTQMVIDLIESEVSIGIDRARIVIVGWGQGGALALHTAYSYDYKFAGAISISGYLPDKSIVGSKSLTDTLLMHGSADTVISTSFYNLAQEKLKWAKIENSVGRLYEDVGHEFTKEMDEDLTNYIFALLDFWK